MDNILINILYVLGGIVVGLIGTIIVYNIRGNSLQKKKESITENARKEADKMKRDSILEAKEEMHKLKIETDREIKEKKQELKESENRLSQRESNMDKRDLLFQKREEALDERENKIANKQAAILEEQTKVEEIKNEQIKILQDLSGISREEAKTLVMEKVKESLSLEIANYIKERENDAKLECDKKAREMLVLAMQRYAADVSEEQTVTVVSLPNDEMKGRIIGREGRNIRTIEAITGVDLIIDDTPEAVVLSSFDPLRREIARITLETLIKDGRIHPTRIEELYDKTCKDINQKIIEYGENALFRLGLTKMDPKLVEIVGKLHFRTSYGQNALSHSIEVAELSGTLAGELGENVNLAKRAGLLHDIGKAIDHEMEGSHVEIGVDLAKKYHEPKEVINAIASHHGDTEPNFLISTIVAICDSLSASRPGARNDSLENYLKRLEQLEKVTVDIPGIEKTFAVQAGRELRVIVKPDEVDDLTSYKIARDVKEKIEKEMQYPGTIKITVIREIRAQEEAK
ncbi:MAG: ribonuclease Y [Erysipelotrichaceae bacterium]|nr:ribonuclease Y [Erysipelotrichaceae bacterium]